MVISMERDEKINRGDASIVPELKEQIQTCYLESTIVREEHHERKCFENVHHEKNQPCTESKSLKTENGKKDNFKDTIAKENSSMTKVVTGKNKQSTLNPNQLKELLVLQLDLIEEQQYRILQKDKQIISLCSEKEQLEARLSRMERRISVQRKHSQEITLSNAEELPKQKLLALKSPASAISPVIRKPLQVPETSENKVNYLPVTVTSCNDKDFWFENFLRTNLNYLEPPYKKIVYNQSCNKNDSINKKTVPVPPWRLVQRDSNRTLDGFDEVEDISDNMYERRHGKPEQEEKRRKRWDIQQARQQRQHEMLIQRYNEREQKGKGQTQPPQCSKEDSLKKPKVKTHVESIYKDSSRVMAMEISEIVPVCAFGYPVPSLPPRELELPWFSIAKREIQLRSARQKHIVKSKRKARATVSYAGRKRKY